jgi:hypothetical protein
MKAEHLKPNLQNIGPKLQNKGAYGGKWNKKIGKICLPYQAPSAR